MDPVTWHLRYNFFPPLDPALVPCAQAALDAAEAVDLQAAIPMPAGYPGPATRTAAEVIAALRLEDLVTGEPSPAERPEFPTYTGWDGQEHAEF